MKNNYVRLLKILLIPLWADDVVLQSKKLFSAPSSVIMEVISSRASAGKRPNDDLVVKLLSV
jgi:hypothetical protein